MADILSQERTSRVGRPPVEIDVELLKSFLSMHMPVKRIAAYFNCDPRTIYRNYGDIVNQYHVMYEYDILAKQKELADAGDVKMLIHIGRTLLKQTENAPIVVEGDDDAEGVEFVIRRPQPAQGLSVAEQDDLDA